MKKPFTAPVWFMLIFSILYILIAILFINYYYRTRITYNVNYTPPLSLLWRMICWPALMLVESFLYWRIRNRNRYRLDSWLHCWLFVLTFLVPIFISILAVLHYGNTSTLKKAASISLWMLFILSHIFFLDALIKSFRYKPPQPAAEGDNDNLLDEFVS